MFQAIPFMDRNFYFFLTWVPSNLELYYPQASGVKTSPKILVMIQACTKLWSHSGTVYKNRQESLILQLLWASLDFEFDFWTL